MDPCAAAWPAAISAAIVNRARRGVEEEVLDIRSRDETPFQDHNHATLPRWLRPFGHYNRKIRNSLTAIDGLTGLTDAGRTHNLDDRLQE
jgi:hypothetical protein